MAAFVIGLGIVALALAVTWQARPAERPGDRAAHPKGWPTPLAAAAGMPGAWAASPVEAFRDKRGDLAARPILLGMAWIVAIAAAGAALGGRSVPACLPGALVLVTTYLLGVHVLRIPSRALCMTLSAPSRRCGSMGRPAASR